SALTDGSLKRPIATSVTDLPPLGAATALLDASASTRTRIAVAPSRPTGQSLSDRDVESTLQRFSRTLDMWVVLGRLPTSTVQEVVLGSENCDFINRCSIH